MSELLDKAVELVRALPKDTFPHIGRRQSTGGIRKLVTGKHGYIVYDAVDEQNSEVAVLAIQHPARERPWSDH